MDNASERDHKPKLHCACCQLHWENVLIVRKSLAEAEAQIAAAQADNERLRSALINLTHACATRRELNSAISDARAALKGEGVKNGLG